LFFLKVPIKLTGGVIKALAEQRINDKPVEREELLLMRFDDEASWKGGVHFEPPFTKDFTMMLPDGTRGRNNTPKISYRSYRGRPITLPSPTVRTLTTSRCGAC
jgi:hypothetical protein